MEIKKCVKCFTEKPRGEFHIKRDNRDGLASKCKACIKSVSRAMYEAKKQKYRDWYKSNSERLRSNYFDNADKRREYQRLYRRKRWESNPERLSELNSQYLRTNKGKAKSNARTARRYASKKQATPAWANSIEIAKLYEQAARITQETGILHEVDHIVPLRSSLVCGLHCESNLRIILRSENRRKSNSRWPDMP